MNEALYLHNVIKGQSDAPTQKYHMSDAANGVQIQ